MSPWKVTMKFKDRVIEKEFPTSYHAFYAERAVLLMCVIWGFPLLETHVEEVNE